MPSVEMCSTRFCGIYAFWGSLYVTTGLLLCVTGTYFVVTFPVVAFGIHVWGAVYDIIAGTVIIMFSLLRDFTISRGHRLLYIACSLVVVNVISLLIFELGEWNIAVTRELERNPEGANSEALMYTRWITTGTTAIVIAAASINFALTYLEVYKAKRDARLPPGARRTPLALNFDVNRPRTMALRGRSVRRYIQSWVLNAESAECPSPLLQLAALSRNRRASIEARRREYTLTPTRERRNVTAESTLDAIGDGDQNRAPLQSIQGRLSPTQNSPPSPVSYLYACDLPPITDGLREREFYVRPGKVEWVDRSGPSGGAGSSQTRDDEFKPQSPPPLPPKPDRYRPENLKLPFTTVRPDGRPQTVDRGCDAELSKEMEIALKMVEELEASKTRKIDENLLEKLVDLFTDKNDTESTKTISAASSLENIGKNKKNFSVESQTTSGYNSLSLDRSLRLTPTTGISSSDLTVSQENSLSCIIQHLGDTAVISLFPPNKQPHPHFSVEKVSQVPGEKEFLNGTDSGNRSTSLIELKTKTFDGEEKFAKGKIRKWRHLIDKRRRPSLLPELENAIIKSESLAFLSKSELKDRLNQTKNIHRKIKRKIHRQRSLRKADSFGSIEDMIDIYKVSTCL